LFSATSGLALLYDMINFYTEIMVPVSKEKSVNQQGFNVPDDM